MPGEKQKRINDHVPEEARAHIRKARAEMRKSFEGLLPPGFLEHRRAARKEMLLAAKEMIDFAINRLERRDTP